MTTDPATDSSEDQPLRGRSIAVTASRRAHDQVVLLERRGADVSHAAAIEMIPIAQDEVVRKATRDMIDAPADLVVLTTATGVRWWLQVCEEWGVDHDLLGVMESVPLYSRGPKTTGALRAAGLREHASAKTEATPELLQMLVDRGVDGLTVAVQIMGSATHWNPMKTLVDGLREAGATVIEVPLYRWELTSDLEAFDELVRSIAARRFDGVTFTSAPAAIAMLDRADALGVFDDLLDALAGPTLALCVGPVTSAPLDELGVRVSMPERMRLGSLMRHTTEVLSDQDGVIHAAGHALVVCAAAALVDGERRPLSPASVAILQALAERPGVVLSRADLLERLPGSGNDEHAVETAVGRLRQALGASAIVSTVVKRGYRLAV